MSSSDVTTVLQSIGHDLIQSFVAVTVETFVIAVYSVFVFISARLLLKTGTRNNVTVLTFLTVLTMYGLALSLWMIDIHEVITEMSMTLLVNSSDLLADQYSAATNKILRLLSIEDVLYAYMTILGDGIIIWRVYAFWWNGWERFVLFIPLAFLGGSIASSLMLTYCAARLGADIKEGTYQHPAFCRNIQTASYSTTLATTGVATLLIAYKTWKYRRMHIVAFGNASPMTRTQRIMYLLVESGIAYMLFFLVQVILSLDSVNISVNRSARLTFAFTIYEYISDLIVGIYPTLLVILVHSKNSVLISSDPALPSTSLVFRGPSAHAVSTAASAPAAEPLRAPAADSDLFESKQPHGSEDAERDAESEGMKVHVRHSLPYNA